MRNNHSKEPCGNHFRPQKGCNDLLFDGLFIVFPPSLQVQVLVPQRQLPTDLPTRHHQPLRGVKMPEGAKQTTEPRPENLTLQPFRPPKSLPNHRFPPIFATFQAHFASVPYCFPSSKPWRSLWSCALNSALSGMRRRISCTSSGREAFLGSIGASFLPSFSIISTDFHAISIVFPIIFHHFPPCLTHFTSLFMPLRSSLKPQGACPRSSTPAAWRGDS